jgi:hypothetical protein
MIKEKPVRLIRLSVLVIAPFLASSLYPQSTGVPVGAPAAASKSAPENVLYWAFFGHVTWLDNTAAALQRSVAAGTAGASTKPANLTGYYKRRLRLTDTEDAVLHNVAAIFDAAVKQKDEAAKVVIKNLRPQLRSAKSSSGTPQVPQQLIQLQAERDAIISSHNNLLKAQMGPSGFQKVDTFVNTAFATHASTQLIDPSVAKAAAEARLAKTDWGQKSGSGTKLFQTRFFPPRLRNRRPQ